MYRIVFFLFLIVLSFNSFAQEKVTSKEVEEYALKLYQNKEWGKLYKFSDKAIKQGFDYFYLRQRAGEACFYMKNYRKAIVHLKEALAYNNEDVNANYFMYYSLLFSGRTFDANQFVKNKSSYIKEAVGYEKQKLFSNINITSGPTISDTKNKMENIDIDGTDNISGNALVYENTFNTSIGLKHDVFSWLSVFHSFSMLNLNQNSYTSANNLQQLNSDKIRQYQYYFTIPTRVANGLIFIPFANIIAFQNYEFTTTIGRRNEIVINKNLITSYFNVFGGKFSKEIRNFTIQASFIKGNLLGSNQTQIGLSLYYFPLGNTKLYFKGKTDYYTEDNSSRFINTVSASCNITKKIIVNGTYYFGDITHFIDDEGYVVNNAIDKSLSMFNFSINYLLNKKTNLFLAYNFNERQGLYNNTKTNNITINNYYKYTNQTIIGGLKWNF